MGWLRLIQEAHHRVDQLRDVDDIHHSVAVQIVSCLLRSERFIDDLLHVGHIDPFVVVDVAGDEIGRDGLRRAHADRYRVGVARGRSAPIAESVRRVALGRHADVRPGIEEASRGEAHRAGRGG